MFSGDKGKGDPGVCVSRDEVRIKSRIGWDQKDFVSFALREMCWSSNGGCVNAFVAGRDGAVSIF